ncbi:MAG: hypothetical protein GSR84_02270 [Desulfurococcales archaeon]|nr:hypothetical protein [Desulfurococcales archaeon]
MEGEVARLAKLLLLTLSVPIKPGAIHRLRLDDTFEQALEEAVHIISHAEEAYKRGVELRRGDRSLHNLGLGRIIQSSLVKVFEDLEKRPLLGLHVAVHTSALLLGYDDGHRSLLDRVKTLYRIGPDDVVAIIDGMEASSLGDEVRFLDSRGITRRSVALQGTSLGDFYEVMSTLDTGFLLNLKGVRTLKEAKPDGDGNVYKIVLDSYLSLARTRRLLRVEDRGLRYLAKLDREIGLDSRFNRLLGGTFLLTLISTSR